jgi:hypothetical protein
LNRQQENKVLETYYWKEVYKENLDSMFLQAYDCQLALNQVKYNYISLSGNYSKLEEQYYILQEGCTDELRKKDGLLEEKDKYIAKSEKRKTRWRTIALAEGGTLVVIITLLVLL